MPNTSPNDSPVKAGWWTGASWLLTLCILESLLGIFYVCVHKFHEGHEYVQLEIKQLKAVNDLLGLYPDTQSPTCILQESMHRDTADKYKKTIYDSVVNLRENRTIMIRQFLRTAYNENVNNGTPPQIDIELHAMDSTLRELNTRDVGAYIAAKRFKLSSFFWLSGSDSYWEAVLWSLFGVITSLIYYVSNANKRTLQNKTNDDIGAFDTSEIGPQVAKMFYAPAVTLVLVLGYAYIASDQKSMIDISVNHGLIIFSFIAGFYSGRLMKFLDGLKNLLLPLSSDSNNNQPAATTPPASSSTATDISITLQLSEEMAADPDAPAITEAGFNTANVVLTPVGGAGQSITLDKPSEDQGSIFTKASVPNGKYDISVKYSFNKADGVINLIGESKDQEISAASKTFTIALKKDSSAG